MNTPTNDKLVSPQNPNKTQMTAPAAEAPAAAAVPTIPSPPAETADPDAKVAAPKPASNKKVKIKANRAILLSDGRTLGPNQEAEVSESDAEEFCDRVFKGSYTHAGERQETEDVKRHEIKRAVRLN